MFPKKSTRNITIDNQKYVWRINDREFNLLILCAHFDYQSNFIEVTTNYTGNGYWLNPRTDDKLVFGGFGSGMIKQIIVKASEDGWKYNSDKGHKYNYDANTNKLSRR